MDPTVSAAKCRSVNQWLRETRQVTGLAALTESKRKAATARNARLRQRIKAQRQQRGA